MDNIQSAHRLTKIGTHSGTFHCDEVFAIAMLRQLPEYASAEIIRTRDPQLLSQCDIVVDVGAEYDPARHRYDHHQKEFNETFHSLRKDKPWKVKLSSAGLIYLHFGEEVLSHMTQLPRDSPQLRILYDKMYENFVMEVDAIDNGVAICDGKPRYSITTGLSSRVGDLNPWWNQPSVDIASRFNRAMDLVAQEFSDRVDYFLRSWLPARESVQTAWDSREHGGGRILVFKDGSCPWKQHLRDIETAPENSAVVKRQPLLVLFPDNTEGAWRVQTIPVDPNQPFSQRLPLPESWRGLRDEALSAEAGIPQCIFVHATGFIGGNKTFEGALAMAKKTMVLAGLLGSEDV